MGKKRKWTKHKGQWQDAITKILAVCTKCGKVETVGVTLFEREHVPKCKRCDGIMLRTRKRLPSPQG